MDYQQPPMTPAQRVEKLENDTMAFGAEIQEMFAGMNKRIKQLEQQIKDLQQAKDSN